MGETTLETIPVFRGVTLEDYSVPANEPGSVCAARGCHNGLDDFEAFETARVVIGGYTFCAVHGAQVEAYTEPEETISATPAAAPIDKPFAYHKPSEDGHARITRLREAFSVVKAVIEATCPESRHRAVALTELETAAMWAIKAVVFNDPASVVE